MASNLKVTLGNKTHLSGQRWGEEEKQKAKAAVRLQMCICGCFGGVV